MGGAIAETAVLGLAVALTPLAPIAVLLLLSAGGRGRQLVAFVSAWVIALAGVCTLVLVIADSAQPDSDSGKSTFVRIVYGVVAALLLVLAVRQLRAMQARGGEPYTPGWMTKIDALSVRGAIGLALLFALVKPKNLLLSISAGVTVAHASLRTGQQALAIAAFVICASAGVIVVLALSLLPGGRGERVLGSLRRWMIANNDQIVIAVCLLIGVLFAVQAIAG